MDLHLGWKRFYWDISRRQFLCLPHVISLINQASDDWIVPLVQEIDNGTYSPLPAGMCEVPKSGFNIRPVTLLHLRDWIVYYSVVQKMMKSISTYILGADQKDYAYRLTGDINSVPWYKASRENWDMFREVSLKKMAERKNTVLFTDIAGFYENIDYRILKDKLIGLGVNDIDVKVVFMCFNRWSSPRGRGIPQGCSASDILAKLYLTTVDRRLAQLGFDHARYCDDFRIFCKNDLEAKKALRALTSLLRDVGLTLQTEKTAIKLPKEAKAKIEGVIPRIKELAKEFKDKNSALFESPHYLDRTEEVDESTEGTDRIHVLEQAFQEDFVNKNYSEFNPTLFHYVLGGLGKYRSVSAVRYMITLLKLHPEETEPILKYLSKVQLSEEFIAEMTSWCQSEDAIYEYQLYLIIEFFRKEQLYSNHAIALARYIFNQKKFPYWLRYSAIALLGEVGREEDLEAIEAEYSNAIRDEEKAIIICALKKMSKSRRNSFYGRCSEDGFLPSYALRWAKTNSET